jgi:hypothetical protein
MNRDQKSEKGLSNKTKIKKQEPNLPDGRQVNQSNNESQL